MTRKNLEEKISDGEWQRTAKDYLDDRLKTIIGNTAKKLGISIDELLSYLIKVEVERIRQFKNMRDLTYDILSEGNKDE